MTSGKLPLVTLGVPVRNGAKTLAAALDSIVGQDYPNLEVIISDNYSDDETAAISRSYAQRFPFIRVVRPPKTLSAIDNFLFVLSEARGEFFAWCAHDDTRSSDFVSKLLTAFEHSDTVLAFGDLVVFDGVAAPELRPYPFSTEQGGRMKRMWQTANIQCYDFYGLWRTSALRSVRYSYTHWWSDLPILLATAAMGTFRYVPGPQFRYFEIPKSSEARAAYQDNRATSRRLENFAALFRSILLTVGRTAGYGVAAAALGIVAEKYVREAFRRIGRRPVAAA